ncbi:uncharacterized protein METZ01_LOCUS453821, partial [marine metagenome]
ICVFVAAIVMTCPAPVSAQQTAQNELVTFSRDIAPILQRSCQECHRPGSIAPMSLLTYEEVRPWARAIRNRTGLRTKPGAMPPWYVEKDIGIQRYKNDPSLSDEEIRRIATWVDNGAPQGNPADLPPQLSFPETVGWTLGEPDLILSTPSVEILAGAPDWWGPIGNVPTGLTENRYVSAVEMKEVNDLHEKRGGQTVGSRFVFHHLCWGVVAANGEDQIRFPCHEVGRNADVFDPDAGRLLSVGSKADLFSTHL